MIENWWIRSDLFLFLEIQVREIDSLNILLDTVIVRQLDSELQIQRYCLPITCLQSQWGVAITCNFFVLIGLSASSGPSQKDWGTSAFGGDGAKSDLPLMKWSNLCQIPGFRSDVNSSGKPSLCALVGWYSSFLSRPTVHCLYFCYALLSICFALQLIPRMSTLSSTRAVLIWDVNTQDVAMSSEMSCK